MLVVMLGHGQAALGFSNLDGFPDVIHQGTHYNLSGWIVNHGTVTLTGNVDIKMDVNGGNILPVDNNFQLSNLAPGDSVHWSKNNHNFPPGQFRLGNNDILIWSTAPAGSGQVELDTLVKPVYYTEGAAFQLRSAGFDHFGGEMEFATEYSFTVEAVNLGAGANATHVKLYAEVDGHGIQAVTQETGVYGFGETVVFEVKNFEIRQAFGLWGLDSLGFDDIAFYVLEDAAMLDPLNEVKVGVVMAVNQSDPIARERIRVYPNPCQDMLRIVWPMDLPAVISLRILDLSGQVVMEQELQGDRVDLSHLSQGYYLLELKSDQGRHQQPLVRW